MSFSLSADGKTVATADMNRGEVVLIDRDMGNRIRRLETGLEAACQVAFSPAGRKLAVVGPGAGSRNVILLDSDTGRELRRFDGHRAMAFSYDGRWLAADSTGKIDVWEVETGKKRITMDRPSEEYFRTAVFSPDGRMLLCSGSRLLTARELSTGGVRFRLQPVKGYCSTVAMSPDGRWLAADDGEDMRIWDVSTRESRRVFAGHNAQVTALTFSPDGRRLAAGSYDTNIMIWDMAEVKPSPRKSATSAEMSAAWEKLAAPDAAAAWAAIGVLADNSSLSVPLLREQLQPAKAVDRKLLGDLLSKLDAAAFADREQTERAISRLGDRAKEQLAAFLANNPSAEARKRAQKLLDGLGEPITNGELLRGLRAIEALERIATDDAKVILRKLAAGQTGCRLTVDSKAALARLGDSSVALPPK
jgi:hypothetical protein